MSTVLVLSPIIYYNMRLNSSYWKVDFIWTYADIQAKEFFLKDFINDPEASICVKEKVII